MGNASRGTPEEMAFASDVSQEAFFEPPRAHTSMTQKSPTSEPSPAAT